MKSIFQKHYLNGRKKKTLYFLLFILYDTTYDWMSKDFLVCKNAQFWRFTNQKTIHLTYKLWTKKNYYVIRFCWKGFIREMYARKITEFLLCNILHKDWFSKISLFILPIWSKATYTFDWNYSMAWNYVYTDCDDAWA